MYLQFLDRHAPANSVDSYQMQQNETPELGLHFADHLLIQQFLDISTSSKRDIDCLCWGLTTPQPLWVILCSLPEKGRKEIEEIVEMKDRDREERGTGMKVKKQKK